MPTSPYLKISLLAALLTSPLMYALSIFAQEFSSEILKPKIEKRALFATLILATDTVPPPPTPPLPVKEPSTMWSWPQAMPYPAACDSMETSRQRDCSNELITGIIYDNLRWPAAYLQNCVEGTVVVSFIVEKDGTLTGFKVRRSITALLDEEALRLVKLMAEETSPWRPGTTGPEKKPVEVQFNMPVKFKLE